MDPLIGLKENVIIGKLIPAGTGMKQYRNVMLDTTLPDSLVVEKAEEVEARQYEEDDEEYDVDVAEDALEDEEFAEDGEDAEEYSEDVIEDEAADDEE